MTRDPYTVLRIEIATAIVSAILGALCLLGGHLLHQVSLLLFGWAGGCAFHIIWMYLFRQLPHQKNPRSR